MLPNSNTTHDSTDNAAVDLSADSSLLDARGLTRKLHGTGRVILHDLRLAIQAGNRIGITGDSGAGKSTLLRSLAMMDADTGGELRFRNQIVSGGDVPAFRRSVAYLAQQPGFVDGTVRDNLQLAFRFASAVDRYDDSQSAEWLHQLGRDRTILDQDASGLSGGERQMVSFVRALLVKPVVLLMDEPTAAMDSGSADKFESLALDWCESDHERAFVWIGHDASQILRVTNRHLRMESGRLHES